ncbi:MAG: hypothetical protein N3C12_14155 [Candidatus Binatia bacterium]|nr:hypothetical protein [Candidatus Binatia bacterium]
MRRHSFTWVARLLLGLWCAVVVAACGSNEITSAVEPTGTPTSTATSFPATPTPTRTATELPPATASPTPPPTLRMTATPTASFTPIPPTSTATSSQTPTATATLLRPARLLYSLDVSNPRNPFPSDRLLAPDGRPDVPPAYLELALPGQPPLAAARVYSQEVARQLRALDGFSTFAPIRVPFDQPVVADAGLYPRGIWLLKYHDLAAAPAAVTASFWAPETVLEILPVVPLEPKTTYVLIVTDELTDLHGFRVQASDDFRRLVAGSDLDAAAAQWRERLVPVWDFLAQSYNLPRERLLLTELFTTQSTVDDLVTIRQRFDAGELVPGQPVLDRPLGDLQTGIFPEGTDGYASLLGSRTTSNVSAVAVGYFDSFDFRERPNGAFDPAKIAGTVTPSTNKVDFYMVLPKAAKPATGYPVVIFGHGLGGSGRDVTQIARTNLDLPLVGIAISALQHGRRGNVVNFFNLQSITTTREYFRQTIADFVQLARMIQNAHAAGIAPFDQVDPNRIHYLGGSLGGIMGTMFMAVESKVLVGMLSVPGGGLPNILASREIRQLIEPLLGIFVGITPDSPYFAPFLHRFQQIAQWALDPADPINYAPYVIAPDRRLPGAPPKRILMHEGIVDAVVPNRTTEDLALAMQLPDLNLTRGCMSASGCSGIWRFVMTDYGQGEFDGHTVTITVTEALRQAFAFLLSDGTYIPDASPGAVIDLDSALLDESLFFDRAVGW